MLTLQQKRDIVDYISRFSTKPIFEDVNSVSEAYDDIKDEDRDVEDERKDEFWEEVTTFLDECGAALENWFENEHCKHLDGQGQAGR